MTEQEFDLLVQNTSPSNRTIAKYGLPIENKIFKYSISCNTATITINFKNCLFEDNFSLINYSPKIDSFFTDCEFAKDIFFWKIQTDKKISFLNCIIKGKFILSNNKIDYLHLNNKYCDTILFEKDSSFNIIEIGGKDYNEIGTIHLPATVIENQCTIDQANILSLRITYSTLEKQLNIFNCNIDSIELDNFRNNGFLRFLNCKSRTFANSEFIISRTNLGKAEFYNFDFASYLRVNIINSILLDGLYISSKWANNIISIDVNSGLKDHDISIFKTKEYASTVREIYKQIKLAMSKQGNVIEEQYFHGLEMRAYNNVSSG